MSAAATREQIVLAADRLFYEQGFDHTSFADVAEAVGISRGNFYYHFRTKDEILDAVVAFRLEKTRTMLDAWAAESSDPKGRIGTFVRILVANRAQIMLWGCPVGTLANELAKLDHVARPAAASIFALFRDWLSRAFTDLGCGDDAEALALHLLVLSQGVATLAAAFRDEAFIDREVRTMCDWVAAQVRGPDLGG